MNESICFVKYGQEPQKVHHGYIEKCFRSTETYAAFYGIAYAAPPDGTKLFQAPEPLNSAELNKEDQNGSTPQTTSAVPSTSTSSLAAPNPFMSSDQAKDFVKKKSCVQPPKFDEGSADCLYLNVFCPRDPKLTKELLPVLVFIHGGGYEKGSNDPEHFSAERIVQLDVVLVTLNYRLGAYGFLNLRTKEVPGNAGLKDQVEALRWIRDNIAYFKGDPENVTLSGWSAGATCVNCHLISPMSKGLFHKAIVQSGGIFWPWGYRGHQFEQIKTILADAKCQNSLHDKEKSKELQKRAHRLLKKKRDREHPYTNFALYGPTSEKYEEGAFLTGEIETIMEQVQSNIPVMAGIVTNEDWDVNDKLTSLIENPPYGYLMGYSAQYFCYPRITHLCASHLILVANPDDTDYRSWIQNDEAFRQILMDNFRWSEETARENANMIRNKYFPSESLSSAEAVYPYMKNFYHDIFVRHFYECFKFGPEKKVHKKLYVYRFEHVSEISIPHCIMNLQHFKVAAHGDDVRYLYPPTTLKSIFETIIYEGGSQNKDILKVMDHMCSLWANFCKNRTPEIEFGPTVEWKPYTEEKPYYLSIDSNLVLKEGSVLTDECIWLNELVNSLPTIQSQKNTPERQ